MFYFYFLSWLVIMVLWVIYWFDGGLILKKVKWFFIIILFLNILLNLKELDSFFGWIMILTQVFIQTMTYWLGLWFLLLKKNGLITKFISSKVESVFRRTWPVDLACAQFLIFLVTMVLIGLLILIYHPVDDMPGPALAAFFILGPWTFVIVFWLMYSIIFALPMGLFFSIIGWRYGWLWVPSVLLIIRLIQSKEIDDILQIQTKLDITEAVVFCLSVFWASYRWFSNIRKDWALGIQISF